jgi:hypothetical protein
MRPGTAKAPIAIEWRDTCTGELIASASLTSDMRDPEEMCGWLHIDIDGVDQHINIVAYPRHFGGLQWYFVCPYMSRRASVLWRPPGARHFASRQRWGRQVAYASQFCPRVDRAHRGQAKINARLCAIGGFDPEEWDFPPKPKWMRWRTYNRAEEKFDRYEAILDEGTIELLAKFMGA